METACRIFEGEEALTVVARVGDALGGLGGCGGGSGMPSIGSDLGVSSRTCECRQKTNIPHRKRATRAKKVVIEEEYTFKKERK
jgi:hypothetical protein